MVEIDESGFQAKVIVGDSRRMTEVGSETIDLIVTSPPYWQIKDYGVEGQIGYGQSLHQYLKDLYRVWAECFRVLRPGVRLCINIGDQFARKSVYGRYKVIPLHAEIISQCETLGMDYMGSILWQKKTTVETSGGAVVMGSYPYPPNGIVELDYEFILIFKKPGESPKASPELKESSRITRDEWKDYFSGHWSFGGVRQDGHQAMFPEELPRRLLRMFSFKGGLVLDPFLGSGTTIRAALAAGRRAVGYEINESFLPAIREKLGFEETPAEESGIQIIHQSELQRQDVKSLEYSPRIQDAVPVVDRAKMEEQREMLHQVAGVGEDASLILKSGQIVRFLGVQILDLPAAIVYLKGAVVGKKVYLRTEQGTPIESGVVEAYVYLKNKIFVNIYLIKSGIGAPEADRSHRLEARFKAARQAREGEEV